MNKTTNDALTALLAQINAPEDLVEDLTATVIIDAANGDADEMHPLIGQALRDLFASMPESDNLDITAIAEYVSEVNSDLGEAICYQAELCPTCFSDLETCDC